MPLMLVRPLPPMPTKQITNRSHLYTLMMFHFSDYFRRLRYDAAIDLFLDDAITPYAGFHAIAAMMPRFR